MNLRSYILEDDFKITILNNRINVVNYISIDSFDANKIILKYEGGFLVINGEELVISKLLSDEILIEGVLKSLEFR